MAERTRRAKRAGGCSKVMMKWANWGMIFIYLNNIPQFIQFVMGFPIGGEAPTPILAVPRQNPSGTPSPTQISSIADQTMKKATLNGNIMMISSPSVNVGT